MASGISRSKIIRPDLWEMLRPLPLPVRWTAMGLTALADRDGRMVVSPSLIHAEVWGEDPTVTPADVEEHLLLLDDAGVLHLYPDPTDPHLSLLQLALPAREEHGSPSRLPSPSAAAAQSSGLSSGKERASGCESASEGAGGCESERGAGAQPPYDPPPIGCPQHPQGSFTPCGPCGTARARRDEYRRTYLARWGHIQQYPQRSPDAVVR